MRATQVRIALWTRADRRPHLSGIGSVSFSYECRNRLLGGQSAEEGAYLVEQTLLAVRV